MKYKKYSWIGNKVKTEDMYELYMNKQKTKKPITVQVAEAVKDYVNKLKDNKN